MHTIQTTAVITPEHELVIRGVAPAGIPPGEHSVLVTISTAQTPADSGEPFFRAPYKIAMTEPYATFSREEIYEDVDR